MKTFKSHEISEGEWPNKSTMPQCIKHRKPLKFYCKRCLEVCCKVCSCYREKEHSNDILSVEVYNLEDLVFPLETLKTQESKIRSRIDKITSVMSEVSREVESTDEQMNHLWDSLFQALESHKSSMAEKRTAIKSQKLAVLQQQKNELNQLADSIRHVHEVITTCLQSDNASSKASCREFFMSSIQNKIKELETVSLELCTVQDIKVIQLGDISQFLGSSIDIVSPADITKCTVEGIALHSGTVDKENTFSLQTFYSNSQPCIEDQNVTADLEHCSSGKVVSCAAKKDSNMRGAYIITYEAPDRGRYKLTVSVNGKNICGSPFDVTMYMRMDRTVQIEPHKKINNLNQPYQLAFTSKNDILVTQKGSNSIKVLKANDNSSTFNVHDKEQALSTSQLE